MVVVVVGDEEMVNAIERDPGADELHDHTAACIEQEIVITDPDRRSGSLPERIGKRAAGSQQGQPHRSRFSPPPGAGTGLPVASRVMKRPHWEHASAPE